MKPIGLDSPSVFTHGVDAGKRWHDHRIGEGEHPPALKFHLSVADLCDHIVGDPLDAELRKERVNSPARIAYAAEAEVSQERLGRDERDGRDVGEVGLVDLVLDVEEELIGTFSNASRGPVAIIRFS